MLEYLDFESVSRPPTLASAAYIQIRKSIQDAKLVPGNLYSETAVAKVLGMSRTPVREAISTLVREGMIEVSSQRGFYIREFTKEEFLEVRDFTAMVEAYAARALASQSNRAPVARLRASIAELIAVESDPQAAAISDENFHLLMADLAGLKRAKQFTMDLRGPMGIVAMQDITDRPHRGTQVADEHTAIVNAIEAGNPEQAAVMATEHIHNYFHTVLDWP